MPLAETNTPYKAHGFHHHPTERPQMPLAETTVTRISAQRQLRRMSHKLSVYYF